MTGKKVAVKILDKEQLKIQDLGESIRKEISFDLLFPFINHILYFLDSRLRDLLVNDRSSKHCEAY